jgi:hypothetical protein
MLFSSEPTHKRLLQAFFTVINKRKPHKQQTTAVRSLHGSSNSYSPAIRLQHRSGLLTERMVAHVLQTGEIYRHLLEIWSLAAIQRTAEHEKL